MTSSLCPIMFCKNEEIWIGRVLTSLSNVFPHVIVSDTGSTDSTLAEIAKVPNIRLMQYDNLTTAEIGLLRGEMQYEAAKRYGATHVIMVDGDELYTTSYLRYILNNPMPEGMICGYTHGYDVRELDNGELWKFSAGLCRSAVFSVDTKWHGSYPYEGHDKFKPDQPELNHYWMGELPAHCFYHLHQVRRSSRDDEVYLRMEKKYQFAMVEKPELKPDLFWLKSQEDYQDE